MGSLRIFRSNNFIFKGVAIANVVHIVKLNSSWKKKDIECACVLANSIER